MALDLQLITLNKPLKKCCNEKSIYLSINPEAIYGVCSFHWGDSYTSDAELVICRKCQNIIYSAEKGWVILGMGDPLNHFQNRV